MPRTAALAAAAGAAILLLALAGAALSAASRRRRARRGAALPLGVRALLEGVATPLGDALVAFGPAGTILWVNPAAAALAGCAAEELLGRGRDALGPDVALLLGGLERGPASGWVALPGREGARTFAAAARARGEPPVDVLGLRTSAGEAASADDVELLAVDDADIVDVGEAAHGGSEPAGAAPSASPSRGEDRGEEAGAHGTDPRSARAEHATAFDAPAPPGDALASALAAELRAPLTRAAEEVALLRVALPHEASGAAEHVDRAGVALREAEAFLGALAPLEAPRLEAVDADALLSAVLASCAFPAGVRVRRVRGPARALADPTQLREALRHLLRAAAAAMPAGGELALRSSRRADRVVLEVGDTGAGAPPGLDLALAERLLAAQGARLERASVPGRGSVSRALLRPAGDASPRAAPGTV